MTQEQTHDFQIEAIFKVTAALTVYVHHITTQWCVSQESHHSKPKSGFKQVSLCKKKKKTSSAMLR